MPTSFSMLHIRRSEFKVRDWPCRKANGTILQAVKSSSADQLHYLRELLVFRLRKNRLLVAVAVAATFLAPLQLRAEKSDEKEAAFIPPGEVQISTPVYQPNHQSFKPREGQYKYSVSWQGIPAASATLDVTHEGELYRIIASARTASGVEIFYKLRYRAEGTLSSETFYPERAVIMQQENSRRKETEMSFANGEISSVRSQKGRQPEVHRFKSDNFTLDPFSAAFIARGMDWQEGRSYQFDTFNGKTRYLISLTAEEKRTIKFEGKQREVWIIVPRVENLSRPHAEKKLRRAEIYLTTDESRDILQIRSSVFVGTVNTELESFTPRADGLQLVQKRRKHELG